jgi:hypothetical protein
MSPCGQSNIHPNALGMRYKTLNRSSTLNATRFSVYTTGAISLSSGEPRRFRALR